eukprot:521920_1
MDTIGFIGCAVFLCITSYIGNDAIAFICDRIRFNLEKLKQLLRHEPANAEVKFQYKSLIIKNSILSLCGAISTLLSYMIWVSHALPISAALLYFDMFLNCLVIGLMFRQNERHYKRLCGCCVVMCFSVCDGSQTDTDKEHVLRYIKNSKDDRTMGHMNVFAGVVG